MAANPSSRLSSYQPLCPRTPIIKLFLALCSVLGRRPTFKHVPKLHKQVLERLAVGKHILVCGHVVDVMLMGTN